MKSGDSVLHSSYGRGTVLLDQGRTAVIRFEHGIEECDKANLELRQGLLDQLRTGEWGIPLEVISRAQASAIQSVNDAWGCFSRSRMQLLPHQLWVCRQVIREWPTRWLVADDVGLGKTIEAGMILWPLLARGTVNRLLILCPASLVAQWQYRLRTMFDIRLSIYSPEVDTIRSDFWSTHNQVVASLQTLRMENEARQQRLFESEPWDLLLVDEAHHLNADEDQGLTLGYKMVKRLQDEGLVRSMVFFTGTPHRGKNFNFLSLLQLLRPDLFDLRKDLSAQLSHLPQVMIRNNKNAVTDLNGNRLFQKPDVLSETYEYSTAEREFYNRLTEFILTGQAYASTLSLSKSRAVTLVLIAVQKLASSSIAAIRRALAGRLSRIQQKGDRVRELKKMLAGYQEAELNGLGDELSKVEEEIVDLGTAVRLMENEEAALKKLLEAAEAVQEETKMLKIIDVVKERFGDCQILFFTEYKATQSLLMSALKGTFGTECVTFINGDDRADDVLLPDGQRITIRENRDDAARKFNEGSVRFLVSTEAGGEGIDLQENCHTLIHVDLPWNPMRLHQRVGRVNRYGQTKKVQVLTLRNPDTVESLIWDKLNEKLDRITMALGQVTEEPEDMLQLVLGMTSPNLFTELFSEASRVPSDSLGAWFDQKTSSFGGQDVIRTVKDLLGNANKFDFQSVSDKLPQVDLPDLKPFLEVALSLNGRRPREDDEGFSFLTPDAWKNNPAVRPDYRGMSFERMGGSSVDARRLLGVGHAVVDQAIDQARKRSSSLASLPDEIMDEPLITFLIQDRLTEGMAGPRCMIAGIQLKAGESEPLLLKDWEILQILNQLPWRRTVMNKQSTVPQQHKEIETHLAAAQAFLSGKLDDLEHGFHYPEISLLTAFWPSHEKTSA